MWSVTFFFLNRDISWHFDFFFFFCHFFRSFLPYLLYLYLVNSQGLSVCVVDFILKSLLQESFARCLSLHCFFFPLEISDESSPGYVCGRLFAELFVTFFVAEVFFFLQNWEAGPPSSPMSSSPPFSWGLGVWLWQSWSFSHGLVHLYGIKIFSVISLWA